MDRQPSRRRYIRRERPNDPRLTDEPTVFAFQLISDPAHADQDECYALRWAVLRRAIADLEQAHDVRQGLRWPGEDPCDYEGDVASIEEFFFSDQHAQFHPSTTPEAAPPTEDSTLTFDSAVAVSGWYSIEQSNGIFSFRGIAEALSIDIEAARSRLLAWVERRRLGSTERLLPDKRNRDVSLRPARPKRARSPSRTTDELLDNGSAQRAEKVAQMVQRRAAGEAVADIATFLAISENTVRGVLRRHRDELGKFAPKVRHVGKAMFARNAEVSRKQRSAPKTLEAPSADYTFNP